jgi:hypothetical protein
MKVFAKTNSCRETPDAVNLTDLDSNPYVNLAKPRPRSVAVVVRPVDGRLKAGKWSPSSGLRVAAMALEEITTLHGLKHKHYNAITECRGPF